MVHTNNGAGLRLTSGCLLFLISLLLVTPALCSENEDNIVGKMRDIHAIYSCPYGFSKDYFLIHWKNSSLSTEPLVLQSGAVKMFQDYLLPVETPEVTYKTRINGVEHIVDIRKQEPVPCVTTGKTYAYFNVERYYATNRVMGLSRRHGEMMYLEDLMRGDAVELEPGTKLLCVRRLNQYIVEIIANGSPAITNPEYLEVE